jgi:predicted flap endonuclease-1-like 5' DNA nuclease
MLRCNKESVMTFILPEGEAMKSVDGLMPGWSAMWSMWTAGFSPDGVAESYASYAEASQAMWEQSMQFMLLPFSALAPVAAVPAAETAPMAKPATAPAPAKPPAPALVMAPVPVAAVAEADAVPAASVVAFTPAAPAAAIIDEDVEGVAPKLLSKPDGAPDDLILIKGIGPKLNQLLNSLGVWHFRQIVAWTPAEVAWVNAKIDFKGRIQRERWQPQAAELMKASQAA